MISFLKLANLTNFVKMHALKNYCFDHGLKKLSLYPQFYLFQAFGSEAFLKILKEDPSLPPFVKNGNSSAQILPSPIG